MQTFLPYPDFEKCAEVLDNKRLGKQIVECRQIMSVCLGQTSAWKNHPAVQIWLNHTVQLILYATAMHEEWQTRRGSMHQAFINLSNDYDKSPCKLCPIPTWLGNERLHSSHRANLLRKDPIHYGQFGWTEKPVEGYWWPSKES